MTADPLPADLTDPHPARLPPDAPGYAAIIQCHRDALRAGQPGYVDPLTGLYVMTAATHWARGSCCDSGCRHCPYLDR